MKHYIFPDKTFDYKVVGDGFIIGNGHCTFTPDGKWMATDRKIKESNSQSVWLYDMELDKGMILCSKPVFENKYFSGDTRCDFHPRWNPSGNKICFDAIDPETGTLTFFVTVDEPYAGLIPGKRPPLVTNMYVEVELSGRPLADRFAVPRSSVHNNQVYICTPDNRLEIRPVDPEFSMADLTVLVGGLKEGERLVLSDLVPAVDGMKLFPKEDEDTRNRVKAQAAGEAI